jgi:FkbM family methyltransferase
MLPLFREIRSAVTWLKRSPNLFIRKLHAEMRRKLSSSPKPRGTINIGDVVFPYEMAVDPVCMNLIYFGDYDLEVAMVLERFLRPGMTFLDVGANVGYFSALALSLVGTNGHVHSFEPVPSIFAHLEKVARANPEHDLVCNMCGLGENDDVSIISVAGSINAGWNTMVPGFMSSDLAVETVPVRVQRLDEYLFGRGINSVDLIKIDVEGFELPILRGSQAFFEKMPNKPPIICEVQPSAYSKLGCSLRDLRGFLTRYGYRSYDPVSLSPVDVTTFSGATDVLFVSS